MTETLQANIFFLIASIATVVFCILVCIALYYVIQILRSIKKLIDRVEAGSEVIVDDIMAVRDGIKSGSFISSLMRIIMQRRGTKKPRQSSKSKFITPDVE